MKDFRILLDCDGVCYDWSGAAFPHLGIDPNSEKHKDIVRTEHDAPDIIVGKDAVDKTIQSLGVDFWANLELLPWAKRLVKEMEKLGTVDFLTSPGPWTSQAGPGKSIALKRDFDAKSFILLKKKETVAMPNAILIDDKPKNVKKFREYGGWSFLWPNQYKIFDNQPDIDTVMKECINYVSFVKDALARRGGDGMMEMLTHGNGREI